MPQKSPPLRAWQEAALNAWTARGIPPEDFLVTATPGAGKTTFALAAARYLWGLRRADRLIVVTPTDHLRAQWVAAGGRAQFDLRSTPNSERLPSDADGVVVTYAQVAAHPLLHQQRCANKRTLVIFDEVHHAGDDKSWGSAVVDAFAPARHRLSITGTPFRTDDAKIPHIRYEQASDGSWESVSDYTYGYTEALTDRVVRPVRFAAYAGTAEWESAENALKTVTLGDIDLHRSDEEQAWRVALDPSGDWIPHLFAAMQQRVRELRAGAIPDAAALVLAPNQEHARSYAQVWREVTGELPVIILSDQSDAASQLARFRDDPEVGAAISVRMVSEGVDIPRAAVLGYCTTAATPLFFAQAVGRVVRARNPLEQATVFLPSVRRLLALAYALEEARSHVVLDNAEPTESVPEVARESGSVETWRAVSSQARFDTVIATQSDPYLVDEELGIPGLLTPAQEAQVLAAREVQIRKQAGRRVSSAALLDSVSAAEPEPPETPAETAQRLRRWIAAEVVSHAQRQALPVAQVWARLYAEVPGDKNAAAPVALLHKRMQTLTRW